MGRTWLAALATFAAVASTVTGGKRVPGGPAPLVRPAERQGHPRPSAERRLLGRNPIPFEANRGQADGGTRFVARAGEYTALLAPDGLFIVGSPRGLRGQASAVRMRFVGQDPRAELLGQEPLTGKVSYLHGRDPAAWHTGIPTYARVVYRDIYPGSDLVFYGEGARLECDFVVRPGGDPSRIEIAFDGVRDVRVAEGGDLVLATAAGSLRLSRPVVYQRDSAGRRVIGGGYVLRGARRVAFEVPGYDVRRPLVIDPVLQFSTYLGGDDIDTAAAIAVDATGIYVAGTTWSASYPTTPGAFDRTCGSDGLCSFDGAQIYSDAFVIKFDPTGASLLYSTFIGGDGQEYARGIAVDGAGNAYLTGFTYAEDFPVTPGAFQTSLRPGVGLGTDGFVTEIDPTGSSLVYSTYLGGSDAPGGNGDEVASGIAVDAARRAWVTGWTDSADFPVTTGAFQPAFRGVSGPDAFVTALNPAGSGLDYSTYFGGTAADSGLAIAVDAAGHAYVTGDTWSTDLPVTPGALQGTHGGGIHDAFVAKFDPAGTGATSLVYATYLGGNGYDQGTAIAVDGSGNAFVAGTTSSTNFPTRNAYQAACNACTWAAGDAFVAEVNASGSGLRFSTYLGGSKADDASALALDAAGYVTIAGSTLSADFPVQDALQPALAGQADIIVAKLDPRATGADVLLQATFFGGGAQSTYDDNGAAGVALDSSGNVFVTGSTFATDFPTRNALFPSYHGGEDAFVAEICAVPGCGPPPVLSIGDVAVAEGDSDFVDATFPVTLSTPVPFRVTASFDTSPGTADASDFEAVSGVLSFAPGETSHSVYVRVRGDRVYEADETFFVELHSPTNAFIGRGRATGTILNDDLPGLSVADVTVTEPNFSPAVARFVVTLAPASGAAVTVDYTTADGSAASPADYTAVAGSLVLAPGEVSHEIDVLVNPDHQSEGTEFFSVELTASTGSPVAYAQAVGTILESGGFFTVTPCRLVDTRNPPGPAGGPALVAGASRTFRLAGACNVAAGASAVVLNVGVTQPSTAGNLRLYPGGAPRPEVSTINYVAGLTRSNNAVVPPNEAGEVTVYCSQASGSVHLILDVSGYFR